MWRAADEDRVLLMAGQTTGYRVDPRGEYVFGIVTGQPMRSRRNRERRTVQPGELVAWDPSAAHAGATIDGRAWSARLMVIEVADLAAIADDQDAVLTGDVTFPDPVISDPDLARAFLAMHHTLGGRSTRLERDQHVGEWLRSVIERRSAARPPPASLSPHDDRALRLACDYLGDHATRNVGLDELAAAAGIGKFRLIAIFRQRTGLPPHALQIAHRIRNARRLLEHGETIAHTAAATGFTDQSHLHRHFHRSLGLTPAAYQRRFHA
jgi:AraC-like DNA-binding protein